MAIVQRYILRKIAVPALLGLLVITFITVVGGIMERLRDLPLDLVQISDFVRLSVFSTPALVSFILPFTWLLGILMGFGQLAQASELTAMKAAGIPLKRIAMPVIMAGLLLSIFCFTIQSLIQPLAVRRIEQLIFSDMPLRLSLDLLPTGVMHEFVDWRVYIARKDDDDVLHGIMILKPEAAGLATAYYADTAQLVKENGETHLRMNNGTFMPGRNDGEMLHLNFDTLDLAVPKLQPKQSRLGRQSYTLAELFASQSKLAQEYARSGALPVMANLVKDRNELSDRFSLPLMALAVSFVAAPLGARAPRAGRSYAFAVGFGIAVFYFVLRTAVLPRGLYSLTHVLLQTQTPNFLLCIAGLILLWRVDRV